MRLPQLTTIISQPLQLLLIEETSTEIESTTQYLRQIGYDPYWHKVHNQQEFLSALENPPHIILSQNHLQNFTAQDALQILQQHHLKIPLLIINCHQGEEIFKEIAKIEAAISRLFPQNNLPRLPIDDSYQTDEMQQIQNLVNLSDLLCHTQDSEQIYAGILNHLQQSIHADSVGILAAEFPNKLKFKKSLNLTAEEINNLETLLNEKYYFLPSPLIFNQEINNPKNLQTLGIFPLIWQSQNLGILLLGYRKKYQPSPQELQIIKILTSYTSLALEQNRLQTALENSEQKFTEVIDQVPVAMMLCSPSNYKFEQVNQAACDLLGYTATELKNLRIEDITYPEDLQVEKDYFKQILNKEINQYNIKKRYLKKNGETFYADLKSCVAHKDNGDFLYVLGIIQQLNDNQTGETSNLKYQPKPEKIWITKPDLKQINFTNQNSETQGYKNPLDVLKSVHPEDKQLVLKLFHSLAQGKPICQEIRVLLPNNEIHSIYHRCFPIHNEANELSLIVYIAEDITEQKQNIELLHQKLEKEKQLHEIKSESVSIISHEFRNILTNIMMSVELLEHYSTLDAQDKKIWYLERIKSCVNQMTDLLENVLLTEQTETGKIDCNSNPLNLQEICQELVEDFKFTNNNLTIKFDYSINCLLDFQQDKNSLCVTCIDEKLLRHILVNLLSNAIKYSPMNQSIEFKLIYLEGEIVFEVIDQGIGIPEKDIPHLFESFHRASNVGKIPGTGLGLAIVKKAVDLHRGNIFVESRVGRGTKFIVRLPVSYRNI